MPMPFGKIFKKKEDVIPEVFSPEAQRLEIIKTLQPDEIKINNPELFWGMYKMWCASFHIEDLEDQIEPTIWDKMIPMIPWGITALALVISLFKK